MSEKILIVEDDGDISELLAKILRRADYHVVQAFSGTEAKLLLEKELPDAILSDLMLPGMTGEELLQFVREELRSEIPVIVLSAKNSVQDKVTLLRSGADDYIPKPFEPEEVIARIEVQLRRKSKVPKEPESIAYKNLMLYIDARKVTLCEKELALTSHEFDILKLLMQNPEKVYSRESLYEQVWNGGYYGENNTVNVHVGNIRRKMKAVDAESDYIQTVYGIGFKLA